MLVLTMRTDDKAILYQDGKEIGFIQMVGEYRNFHGVGFELPKSITILRDNAKVKRLDGSAG